MGLAAHATVRFPAPGSSAEGEGPGPGPGPNKATPHTHPCLTTAASIPLPLQVDAADSALSAQLQAWSSWTSDALATGQQGVQQPQYAALANALAQAVASEVVPGSSLGAIAPDALDAAFAVDAAGANAVAPERLSHSLAALATACGADGSAAAAAAVLELLLAKLQPQAEQLLRQAAAVTASSSAPAGAGAGDGNDSDDELDKLLAEDAVAGGDEDDVSPVSDQTQVAAAPAPAPPQAPAAAAGDADDDGDDALSLGLSRSTSIASASAAPAGGAVATAVARVTLGSAVQHDSAKSLGGKSMGALSRALSAASSDGLDDLPDNLDAMETRGASHGAAGASKGPRTKPLLAGLMESEQGKGSMASMPTDLRDWSNLKNRQPGAAMVVPPGHPPPGARGGPGAVSMRRPAGGHLMPLSGKPGAPGAAPAGAPPPPVHAAPPPLLSSRTDGPKANPLHNALMNSSAVRQSHDRAAQQQQQQQQHHHHHPLLQQHGSHASSGSGNSFVSRKESNNSSGIPAGRQRSLNSHMSRKASISEPGPLGPQVGRRGAWG